MTIQDRVIIITGASSGIGRAAAVLLASRGAKVVLAARTESKLTSLSKDLPGSLAVQTDITDMGSIKRLVAAAVRHFGRIDILLNNAGIGLYASAEKTSLAKLQQVFDTNLKGPLAAMQAVIPVMRKEGGGMIINISSGTALMHLPNMSIYSGLKRALTAVSLTSRQELAKDKIIVSVLYPYITLTDFAKNSLTENAKPWDMGPGPGRAARPPDSAEFIAGKIADLITSEVPEMFAHDWMQNMP